MLAGEGVSVGIIDTGIDFGHWAFDRERATEVNLDRDDAAESGFVIGHGTSVASVIAAQPGSTPREFEDIGLRGVAPGAKVTVFAVADRGPVGPSEDEEPGWFGPALAPDAAVHGVVPPRAPGGRRTGTQSPRGGAPTLLDGRGIQVRPAPGPGRCTDPRYRGRGCDDPVP